ncbi:MAG: cation diffusion facilitator family transporter [Holophagae bacterium]|jgi:cation diffusion facilitator family transporter
MKRTESTTAARIRLAGWVGLIVNLVLAAAKLGAGVVGHSQAVVADAVHSFTDIVTDLALILGVRYWTAPADDDHPHGHRRFETMITVFIGLMVAAAAVTIGLDAIRSFGSPTAPPSAIALVAALLSIVVKEALYRWTAVAGRATGSPALIANAWHHRTDGLSSIPVAVAVAVAMIDHRLAVVDRIGALVVALFILHAAFRIIRPAIDELVDAGAPSAQREQLERLALDVEGVLAAHALRTRYIGSELAVDLHIEVDPDITVADGFAIARRVKQSLLRHGPGVADVVVQLEPRQAIERRG